MHPLTTQSLDITLTQSVHGILEYITYYWGLYYQPYNATQSVFTAVLQSVPIIPALRQ